MLNEILESPVEIIPYLSEQFSEKDYFMNYTQFQEKFGAGKMTAYLGAYLKYHPLPKKHAASILNNELGYGSRILDMLPSEFWKSQLPDNILQKIQGLVIQDLSQNAISPDQLNDDYYVENKVKIDQLRFHCCEKYLFGLIDNVFRKIYDEQDNLQELIARQLPHLKDNKDIKKCILDGLMISFSLAITEIYSSQKEHSIPDIEFRYQVWNPISNILNQNNIDTFVKRTEELKEFIEKAEVKLTRLQREMTQVSFQHPRFNEMNDKSTILKALIKNNKDLIEHKIFLTATYTYEQKEKLTGILHSELIEFTRVLAEAEAKLANGIDELVTQVAEKTSKAGESDMNPAIQKLIDIKSGIKTLIGSNQELIRKGGDSIAIDYLDQQEHKVKKLLEEVRTNEIASHHSPIVRLINALLSIFTDWQIRTPVEAAAKEMDKEISTFQIAPH